jgi:protein tyrosine/serine phosphatase
MGRPAIAWTLLVTMLGVAWARPAHPGERLPREVAPGIYRSAQPDAEVLRAAHEQGLRTVVVLRTGVPEHEHAAARELGLELVHVPMDGSRIPSVEEVDRALEVVLDASRRPVLVHCAHGEERTGAVIAAYRVVAEGWDPAAAEAEALELGFGFDGLAEFLVRYRDHRNRR